MLSTDRDKLIAAVYSVGMSPEYYDESLETIDALVLTKMAEGAHNIQMHDRRVSEPNTAKSKHRIDPEILHHVRRSNDINDRIGRQNQERPRAELLLDTAPNPAFIFDSNENIVAMNDLAKNKNDNACHLKLAECCANIYVLEKVRKFVANRKNQKLLIEPGYINTEHNMNTCILVRKIDTDLKVRDDKQDRHSRELYFFTIINLGFDASKTDLFKETYGLTRAEVEVAVHLASGQQLPEIAADRGVKIQTIRNQIKEIKSKTHSRDVPSIVRLVCGFSAGVLTSSHLSTSVETNPQKTRPLSTHRHITLRDGRALHYLEQGDPEGVPVLMLHTIPHGAKLMPEASKSAMQMNLRIISPYRPGFAQSDACHVRGEARLDIVAADIHELLGKLNIVKVMIVGVGTGSIYALRFTSLYPNRVSHLFAVSRTPMWREEWISKVSRRQRLMIRLTRHTPQLLPLVMRATTAYIDRGHAKDLCRTTCGGSAADMLALENAEISGVMEKEVMEGVRQGYESHHCDIPLSLLDFSQEALRLKHRFYVLHGDDDKVVDIAESQAFVDFVPGTELEIVKGAGHLLIYSHWEHVLQAIKSKQK